MIERGMSELRDSEGKVIRWLPDPVDTEPTSRFCCGKGTLSETADHALFLRQNEEFQNEMFEKLDTRSRAIANWKKLRILLVLLRVCGGRT